MSKETAKARNKRINDMRARILAEKPMNDWRSEMDMMDKTHMPRWAEDIIEMVEIGNPLSSETRQKYNEKQIHRSRRPK